jgi:uncharacterized protein CbrC (UPF0167 family)
MSIKKVIETEIKRHKPLNAFKRTCGYVGWVERSETHHFRRFGGFRGAKVALNAFKRTCGYVGWVERSETHHLLNLMALPSRVGKRAPRSFI